MQLWQGNPQAYLLQLRPCAGGPLPTSAAEARNRPIKMGADGCVRTALGMRCQGGGGSCGLNAKTDFSVTADSAFTGLITVGR
jgi:hypothetical protein